MHSGPRPLLHMRHGVHVPVRFSATAAKTKPIPNYEWDSSSSADSKPSPTPGLRKWARREQTGEPRDSPSSSSRPLFSSPSPVNLAKWALPSTPSSSATQKAPSSVSGHTGNTSEDAHVASATPVPPLPLPSGLNKWARPVSLTANYQPGAVSRDLYLPNDSFQPRSDSRLQRDIAPHLLKAERTLRPPALPGTSMPGPKGSSGVYRNEADKSSVMNRRRQPRTFDNLPSYLEGSSYKDGDSRFRRDRAYKTRSSLVPDIIRGTDVSISSKHKLANLKARVERRKTNKIKKDRRPPVQVYIPTVVSVRLLAKLLKLRLETLQKKMVQSGLSEESSYDHVLTSDYAVLLAEEFGRKPIINDEAAFDIYPSPPHPNPYTLPSRPPVVTIMGHVDHGKTTLLDTLRSSSVAAGEAGGITQHIGAFSVPVPYAHRTADGPQSITFLDTPGHAAFSAIRARGANVTDMVVLVVAADDGIMPQTREVIELVKQEGDKISLLIAINKIDKPGADIDSIHLSLMAEGIQVEAMGGEIPCVQVSGLTGQGLDTLTETLSAMAEVQDLRAEREGPVHGHVLESKVQKGLGPVATVLVTRGCLKPSAHIICGTSYGKVRVMTDSTGATVQAAYPGMAVTVSGWKDLPKAGDEVLQGSESDVKRALNNRIRQAELEDTLADVEAINISRREERGRREEEEISPRQDSRVRASSTETRPRELRLIIKGDVSGSVEAIVGAVESIRSNDAAVKVISTGVGDVTESDIMIAKTTEASIVAFSVAVSRSVEAIAGQHNISIHSSNIIYRLLEIIKERVTDLLPVIIEQSVTGEASVLRLFDIQLRSKQTKRVAGCRVSGGIVEIGKKARVLRGGYVIHDGALDTLKNMKDDVAEVRKGSECGMAFNNFQDIQEGDIIQLYSETQKRPQL